MSNSLKIISIAFLLVAALGSLLNSGVLETQSNQNGSQSMMSFAEFDEVVTMPIQVISPLDLVELLMTQERHYNLSHLQSMAPKSKISTTDDFINEY